MKELIGENCWEEEFDMLDQDRDEKITFEDLIRKFRILFEPYAKQNEFM